MELRKAGCARLLSVGTSYIHYSRTILHLAESRYWKCARPGRCGFTRPANEVGKTPDHLNVTPVALISAAAIGGGGV